MAQNQLNLREAWLRTELFGQRLALTAGRLDLTNYFDQNAFANDESTQFLSDALVNNQMLGLSSNGTGVATEFDAKNGFRVKFGFQQSNDDAANLSDSMFTLTEVGYTFTPFALPKGPTARGSEPTTRRRTAVATGFGISLDQKLTPVLGCLRAVRDLEPRPGPRQLLQRRRRLPERHHLQPARHVGRRLRTNGARDWAETERLTEGYYNFHLTDGCDSRSI